MKATETKLQKILEGTNQYMVPLFQRTYSWGKKEWGMLWDDLLEIYEADSPRDHFMGSIVTMPTTSVPEGVAKFLLIDGQQRLTTFFILLAAIRDQAKAMNLGNLAPEIDETLLRNKFKEGDDEFKLMPTHADRDPFIKLVHGETPAAAAITQAYRFFQRKLAKIESADLTKLMRTLVGSLSLVSIVLDRDDNPHLIFESLNAKGRALTQADLLRNYFFMRLHASEQEELYHKYWKPMQEELEESLTECIRHFLMKGGSMVKQGDIYVALKEHADPKSIPEVLGYLEELTLFAGYYARMVHPERESNQQISERMERLNRIEVTTAYPLILNVYHDYASGVMPVGDFVAVLETVENFMIRRWVCNVPTYTLNKLFPSLYRQAKENSNFVEGFRMALGTKSYPGDAEFQEQLINSPLYATGERLQKIKLLLDRLEDSFRHHEAVDLKKVTIEHVMPQTLTPWWKAHLGAEFEDVHEVLLHTLGNLTLTGYNGELSNDDFPTKRKLLVESHLELNTDFANQQSWTETDIKLRSTKLAERALQVWPYFGPEKRQVVGGTGVTGRKPVVLSVLGQEFRVGSWRDVAERTVEAIAMLDKEAFQLVAEKCPTYVGRDSSKFRESRKLSNGYYLLTHYSAEVAHSFCQRAVEVAGLSADDWEVRYLGES